MNLQVVAVVDYGGAHFGQHLALDLVVVFRDDVIKIVALTVCRRGISRIAPTSALGQQSYF